MLIPKHLREISEPVKISKASEIIKIKCNCEFDHFIVYTHIDSEPNIKPSFSEVIRENDKIYLVKRNFFGKIVKKIECGDLFNKKQRKVVKVKCEKCGLEHIIFDNYKHGYDAVNTLHSDATNFDSSIIFENVCHQSLEVYVTIHQDISYNEFEEECENLDFETYLDSFSNIDIYGVNSKSKRIEICSEETA